MTDKWDEAVEIFSLGADMSLNYNDKPIEVCYSGGKDSDVLLEVAKASKKPFVISYSSTTCDSPDTIKHIKEVFKREEAGGVSCVCRKPIYKGVPTSMWKLIPLKTMPPTRIVRYCCAVLKEQVTENNIVATGVRKDESVKRSTRKPIEAIGKSRKETIGYDPSLIQSSFIMDNTLDRKIAEHCEMGKKTCVNPIINFTEREIWQIIYDCHIKVNPMYENGYNRVGCVGCPMASLETRLKEFNDYPLIKERYIKAFDAMVKVREDKGLNNSNCNIIWKNGQDVFDWWLHDPNLYLGQMKMDI